MRSTSATNYDLRPDGIFPEPLALGGQISIAVAPCTCPKRLRALSFPRPSRAFTLIEIMVAIAIFSLVLTAIYASWTAILRASKAGQTAAARVQHSRMTLRALVDSLLCVQMYQANPALYAFEIDTSAEFAYASFVARLPSSFAGSGMFGDQVVRRVTFVVEQGVESPELVMYQMPLLATETAEQKPFSLTLAKDVSLFTLEFWDTRANDWALEWRFTNQLPKLIRLTLGIGRTKSFRSEPDDVSTRVVAVPAMAIPREYQLVTGVQQPGGPTNMLPPGVPGAPGTGAGRNPPGAGIR